MGSSEDYDAVVLDLGLPEMHLLVPDVVLVFDRMTHTIKVIANVMLDEVDNPGAGYSAAVGRIDGTVEPPARGPGGWVSGASG